MIYHVVAMAKDRVIGKDNRLPWHFSEDLKHFKQLTIGHTLLMGRKTFASLSKPLPERENFVLSRTKGQNKEHLYFFASIPEALAQVQTEHCFIIGGENVFQQTVNLIDGIYLTEIHAVYAGDSFYPEIPPCFREQSRTGIRTNPVLEVVYYDKKLKQQ